MSKFKVGDRVVVIKQYMQCEAIGKEGIIIGPSNCPYDEYAVDFGEELENEGGDIFTHDCDTLKNNTGYWIEGYCLELVDEDLIYSETIIRG